MIDILVIRGAGDNPGDQIVDSLLCSVGAAIERGRVEIDQSSINREDTIEIIYRPGLKPGLVVQVVDALLGATWKGIVTSVDLVVDGPTKYANLTLVRHA